MPGCFVCEKEQAVLKSKSCTVGITKIKDGKVVVDNSTASHALCDDCFPKDNLIKK